MRKRLRYRRRIAVTIGAASVAGLLATAAPAEHIDGGDHSSTVAGSAYVKIREVHPKPRKHCVGLGLTILGFVLRDIRSPLPNIRFVESGAIYWHMVDLLWLLLFALFYLIR